MMLVKAVRVFPDPVGDETRTLRLWCMTGMAFACGMVRSPNLSSNQVEMRGSMRDMTSSFVYVLSTLSIIGTTIGSPNMISVISFAQWPSGTRPNSHPERPAHVLKATPPFHAS